MHLSASLFFFLFSFTAARLAHTLALAFSLWCHLARAREVFYPEISLLPLFRAPFSVALSLMNDEETSGVIIYE
jgi:hypothetical protein